MGNRVVHHVKTGKIEFEQDEVEAEDTVEVPVDKPKAGRTARSKAE